jgi:hypothetical protein
MLCPTVIGCFGPFRTSPSPPAAWSISWRRCAGAAARPEPAKAPTKPKKAAGQKEALLPIEGKKPVKETAAEKPAAKPQRKSASASRIDPRASKVGRIAAAPKLVVCGLKSLPRLIAADPKHLTGC